MGDLANLDLNSATALLPCSTSLELAELLNRSRWWTIPAPLREEAEGLLGRLQAQLRPADKRVVADWLASLGTLCAGQMSAEEARMKVSAYADLIDLPAPCFTRATLREAAARFKFWPSYSEICQLFSFRLLCLKDQVAELERLVAHQDIEEPKRIAPPPPPKPKTQEEWMAERKVIDAAWRGIRDQLPDMPKIEAVPGELKTGKVLTPEQVHEQFVRAFGQEPKA